MKLEILYVFGGEKALGAEIVIERLIDYNANNVNAHLIIAPGLFADKLFAAKKSYKITRLGNLRKLYRSSSNIFYFYFKAFINYFVISYKVYRYIKKNNIDVIHVNTIVPASYLLPLIFFSRIILPGKLWIWSDHDMRYFSKLEHFLSKWCLKLYDCTLVVSEAVKRKYLENKKIVLLYNGLDINLFRPDELVRENFRNRLGINESCVVFGIAAYICPGKGQLPLIKAFAEATLIYPNIKLLIAGDYALDDIAYNDAVKKAISVNRNIVYLGFTDKIIDFYNGCDVIINNSDLLRSESLGTSIYEAMACEKILLASVTGGTPEIISDNVDGYLFEAENGDKLKEHALFIIKEYNNLSTLKIAARKKVETKFNIWGMIKEYNEFLDTHIKNKLPTI